VRRPSRHCPLSPIGMAWQNRRVTSAAASGFATVLFRLCGWSREAVVIRQAGQPHDLCNGDQPLVIGPIDGSEQHRLVVGVLDLDRVAAGLASLFNGLRGPMLPHLPRPRRLAQPWTDVAADLYPRRGGYSTRHALPPVQSAMNLFARATRLICAQWAVFWDSDMSLISLAAPRVIKPSMEAKPMSSGLTFFSMNISIAL
jgi:hypothetical protein